MLWNRISCLVITVATINAIQYPINMNSEIVEDSSNKALKQPLLQRDSSSHEEKEKSEEDIIDKRFLEDAMKIVLDPVSFIEKRNEIVKNLTVRIEELDNDNITLEYFMKEMDKLSLEICLESREAAWLSISDFSHQIKEMISIKTTCEENKFWKQYWRIIKEKYFNDLLINDSDVMRKLTLIKDKALSLHVPVNKRDDIIDMQKLWEFASVCKYQKNCSPMHLYEITSIFKTSNDSEELKYYWRLYRDVTGTKLKPIFKEYVTEMNDEAKAENFADAGEIWRYLFKDENFTNTVQKLWKEIKPFYNDLHKYVKSKLLAPYKEDLDVNSIFIPAHLLGSLWADDWQETYRFVAPYPNHLRPTLANNQITAKSLFTIVNDYYVSLGFKSVSESYADINESKHRADCIPKSHDFCDGINFRVKWCGEKITDLAAGLLQIGRLLGRVNYFKSYSKLPLIYRNEPTPAFIEGLSGTMALPLISLEFVNDLNLTDVETNYEANMNNLLWLALGKLPKIGYSYVLDKWRWDVFANNVSSDKWNQHWWELRENETLIRAPVQRNESNLDPASAFDVVSHKQQIIYFIAYILEFQILFTICKQANHTGPLHECNVHGFTEAGDILRRGMSKGALEDWPAILNLMIGETAISTTGILEYFAPLRKFLQEENSKIVANEVDGIDASAPLVFGFIVFLLLSAIIVLLCQKKRSLFSICGIGKNGSLDIATDETPKSKSKDSSEIAEEKL